VDHFNQDVRFALRMLRKNPGFTSIAVLVLAVGIGANTAIFSFVDSVLLRPLPYPNADRLVVIEDTYQHVGNVPISYPQYLYWKDQHQIFDSVVTTRQGSAALTGAGEPERTKTLNVSVDTLSAVGISPLLGRNFLPEEEPGNANPVAMLTESFWRTRFQSSPSVIGEKLILSDRAYTVVGVLPTSFRLGGKSDMVMPLRLDTLAAPEHLNFLRVVGRLRPGINLPQGRSAIQAVFPAYKKTDEDLTGVELTPYRELLVADSRPLLLVLMGAVFAVLLIACTNTANLLLARAAAREKEIAIRISLGAGRARLARQLLTESLLLGMLGGLLGVGLAWASLDGLRSLLAQRLPGETVVHMDPRVLAFAALLAVTTGVVFGMAPVLQVLRGDLHDRLKQGGRQSGGSAGQKLRQILVVSEIAFSLVLLAGAGLLVRSLVRLIDVDKGFSTDHVLTMSIEPSPVRYADAHKETNYIQQISQRVRVLPGVRSAGLVYTLPLSGGSTNGSIKIEGRQGDSAALPNTDKQYLDADYFQAMQIRLLKGRFFVAADTSNSAKVVIVNQAFVREFFPDQDPIGRRIDVNWGDTGWCEIIGIVANSKTETLATPDRPSTFMLYAQNPDIMKFMGFNLVVRTSQEPLSVVQAVRSAIHQLDSSQAIADVKTMDDQLSESLAPRRAPMWLLGAFSGIALFLAAIGIYGVLSFFVLQRRKEIGVRLALGARRTNILELVLWQGARLIGIGVAIGLVAAPIAARALASLLFGVRPTDLPTFLVVSLLLALLGLLACAVPALRATQVDPLVALRSE
jgi:putative ABC transport system permease protein